jgi:hypothetical protein
MGDFDVTILPKNETIRFNFGYSPERYEGPSYTNYHNGGNDFWLLNNMKSKADDWRLGINVIGIAGLTYCRASAVSAMTGMLRRGVGLNHIASRRWPSSPASRQEPQRGSTDFTRFSLHSLINGKLDITGRGIYSRSTANSTYLENFTGTNFNLRITGFPPTPPNAQPNTTNPSNYTIAEDVRRPSHSIDGLTYLASDKFRSRIPSTKRLSLSMDLVSSAPSSR